MNMPGSQRSWFILMTSERVFSKCAAAMPRCLCIYAMLSGCSIRVRPRRNVHKHHEQPYSQRGLCAEINLACGLQCCQFASMHIACKLGSWQPFRYISERHGRSGWLSIASQVMCNMAGSHRQGTHPMLAGIDPGFGLICQLVISEGWRIHGNGGLRQHEELLVVRVLQRCP